jgi:hypothetical protein
VLFLPYGIVGTWRLKSIEIQKGREWLMGFFSRSAKIKADKKSD